MAACERMYVRKMGKERRPTGLVSLPVEA
jgi:hypothetical protein